MNNREYARQLLDEISERKLIYIIPFLQGAAIPDEVSDADETFCRELYQDYLNNASQEDKATISLEDAAKLLEVEL